MSKQNNKIKNKLKYNNHGAIIISYSILLFVCYLLPMFKVEVPSSVTGYDKPYYLAVNLYDFVFAKNYKIGNIQYLFHFIIIITLLVIGLKIKQNKNSKLYKFSYFVLLTSVILSTVIIINILKNGIANVLYGLIIFGILTCVYFFIFIIRFFKQIFKSKL